MSRVIEIFEMRDQGLSNIKMSREAAIIFILLVNEISLLLAFDLTKKVFQIIFPIREPLSPSSLSKVGGLKIITMRRVSTN